MRLKSVRIFGFKTFADRTEFSLDGGIIAVVGPNGCGKSNLVDAILWGLGEGNSRHLRAATSQEVIFGGSARRKAVGYCEVSLLFDNEDGLLPIESPEVSITRRLSRSGESEYAINRRNCRQRDVYELLADSGLGRTGYAIVGQRQIDSALSASSDERRSWIDEAAGVQRYRQRKLEAMRKLDSARDHLQRVADILEELSSQREPLREQAEQAAEYRRVQSTLKETEVTYLSVEAVTARAESARFKDQIEVATRLVAAESFRATAHETKVADLTKEIATIDSSIDSERATEQQEQTAVAKAHADIKLFEAKLEALSQQETNFTADQAAISLRIQEAENEVQRCRDDFQLEESRAQEVRAAAAGSGEETKILSATLDEAERQLKTAVQKEAQRARRQIDREHQLEKRRLAQRELDSLLANMGDLQEAVAAAKVTFEEAEADVRQLKEAAKALVTEQLALKALEDQRANEVRGALSDRAALEGRERGTEETINSFEGMSQGARAVLEAAKKGDLEGEFVSVGQVLQAKKEHAVAIETGLGAAVNDLIVDSERESRDAIGYLKAGRLGRATFQPITLMRQNSPSPELAGILRQPGVLGLASDLATCKEKYRPVLVSLLGRTLVVDNLNTGLRLAKTRGWSKIVTPEADLIHSSGAVTGGAQARQGYGMLQRKADLAQLRKQIDDLTQRIGDFHKGSLERQAQSVKIEERAKELRKETDTKDEELAEARSYLRTLEDELKGALRDREKLDRELGGEILAAEPEAIAIHTFEETRDAALRALATKSADSQFAEERLKESDKRLGQAKARLDTAYRRREGEVQSENARAKRAEAVVPERQRLETLITQEQVHREDLKLKVEAAQTSLSFLRALRQTRFDEREREDIAAKGCRQSLTDTNQSLHQAELNRTRAEARTFAALSRLAEEYSIAESEIPETNLGLPPSDAPTIIARLKRELRAMGDVNMGAIEAFERLTLRFDELNYQRDDILGGIEEVEKSVRELDQLTREKFLTTFLALKDAFSKTFARIFEGGSGSIDLTEPDDVLNSGIVIDVTLPGKKRQSLSLLSGGEQSLCTAAFLFSLLQVKPSPLVVLDEVDAPLDGRNVERYADLLKDLAKQMQFIVITHNPVTIEAADTWLGVTMQEPGVSNLVLTKLPSGLLSSAKSA